MPNSRVTLHDVYELTSNIREDIKWLRECAESNAKRITGLEIWRANIMGKITIVVGVISITFSIIADWFKKKILNL